MKLDLKELISKITNTPVVIEEGTSGVWKYRKWSNGFSECWASVNTSTNFAVWSNPIYYGTTYCPRQNFPTGLFIATPWEQVTMYAGGADVWVGADSTNRVSSTQTGRYYPLRVGSGSTATFNTQFYDFGRWK